MTAYPPNILVLEDEPIILMELSMALEDMGAVPVTAVNPDKALARIKETRIDAAILDVNLGRNSTCEAVAAELSRMQVPFLLHSGDLVRQGELIARIDAEVVAKPAASETVARRAIALASGEKVS